MDTPAGSQRRSAALMRRVEQRRLEATLSRLGPSSGSLPAGAASVDDLLGELETTALSTEARAERHEQLANRLSAALDALGAGVVISDDHGVEVYRNRATGGDSTRTPDVLADQAVREVLAVAQRAGRAERNLELFSPFRRNLQIRAYSIASAGSSLGAVAVIEDISERHRLDAVRRDFVANVSHELKTPVGALSLLAETLDGEEDPEVVTRLAARVGLEAERLGHIIDDLLDLSRIEVNEAGRRDVVDLAALVADAIAPLAATAQARRITLEVGEPPPGQPVIVGDRLDLVSAVSNLVDNAVKYSEDGSSVSVEMTASAGTVRLAVRDQGIGIPAGDLERIFERFYRVDRARSRLTGGTGLGLSIVRHVAVNHGGDIEVSSREGAGSTFTLVLPAVSLSPDPIRPVASWSAVRPSQEMSRG